MVDSYRLYEDKLQGAYHEAFQTVETYVNSSTIDEQSREELLNSLLDMLLAAQENGQPPEKVTGTDMERFCETFCSGFGSRERVFYYLEQVIGLVHILFFLSCGEVMIFMMDCLEENRNVSFFSYHAQSSLLQYGIGLFLIALYGILINCFIKKFLFLNSRKHMMSVLRVVICSIQILLAILIIYGYNKHFNILPDIPVWITFTVTGLITIFHHIATRKRRKENKHYKISFRKYISSLVSEEQGIPQYEKDLYFRRNRKREKKGLPPLTQEEFLVMEKAECDKLLKNPLRWSIKGVITGFIIGLLIILMIGGLGMDSIHIESQSTPNIMGIIDLMFETRMDFVIFIILMALVLGFILYGIWKISKTGNNERLAWIEKELANPTVWEASKK